MHLVCTLLITVVFLLTLGLCCFQKLAWSFLLAVFQFGLVFSLGHGENRLGLFAYRYGYPPPSGNWVGPFCIQFPNCQSIKTSIVSERVANPPGCYRSLSGPPGPKCPGSVPRGVSGPFGRRAPECPKKCPESVPRVSKRCLGHFGDTLGTLCGHSGARGPKGPRDTPEGHSRDTSGPEGPRDSCSRRGVCNKRDALKSIISLPFCGF